MQGRPIRLKMTQPITLITLKASSNVHTFLPALQHTQFMSIRAMRQSLVQLFNQFAQTGLPTKQFDRFVGLLAVVTDGTVQGLVPFH